MNVQTIGSVLANYEFSLPAPGIGRVYCKDGISEHLFDSDLVVDVRWNGCCVLFKCDADLAFALRQVCKPSNLVVGAANSRRSLQHDKNGRPLKGASLIKRKDKLNRTTPRPVLKNSTQELFTQIDEIMSNPLYA